MVSDFRFSLRALRKSPGFALVAILTIALGIGANSAIFSVVHGVLLKPLPYRDSDSLVWIQEGRPDFQLNISYANFVDWRERNQVFSDMALYNPAASAAITSGGPAEVFPGAIAEAKLFDFLGLPPLLGRSFLPDEENAVVISDRLWHRRFGGDRAAIGRSVAINGDSYTVIGILPPEMRLENRDVWFHMRPRRFSASQLDRGNHPGFHAVARLKPGVSLDQAQRAMTEIAKDLEKQYPSTNTRMGVMLKSMLDQSVGSVRPVLLMLLGAVMFVLLIACANVANLMLGRALGRGPEIAVRAALGAGRSRLLRLFLSESLIVGITGGVLGILLAGWAIDGVKILGTRALPRIAEIRLDPPVLAYTAALTLITALLFGLAPAFQASRVNLLDSLKQGGRSGASGGQQAFRHSLIAAEVGLSVVLLVGAGLMIRSLSNLAQVDPGYKASHLLALNTHASSSRYSTPAGAATLADSLAARLRELPGVVSVARAWPFDLLGFSVTPYIRLLDKPVPAGREPSIQTAIVSPGYFDTLAIPLRSGRMFTPADRRGGPTVAIVDEEFVRRFYARENAIGKRVSLVGWDLGEIEIVGIVGNTLRTGLAGRLIPELYVSDLQSPMTNGSLLLRTAGDPLQLSAAVRTALAEVDPEMAIDTPVRVEDALWNTVSNRRFTRYQLMLFAGLALLLAAAGIYGVVSYSITQRTQEFGIRMALGARRADIVSQVLRKAAWPVGIGLLLGMASALSLTRYLANQLYGVRTFDPLTLSGVALALSMAALAGCWVPARRASRLDPAAILR